MAIVILVLIAFIAIEHLYILWLEMFAWTTRAPKIFRQIPKEMFEPTKALAANQGLYNGFLAAGLIWCLCIGDPAWQRHVAVFFLACVAVAGMYGAVTATKRIFFVQALPALVTLLLIWIL